MMDCVLAFLNMILVAAWWADADAISSALRAVYFSLCLENALEIGLGMMTYVILY